MSDDNLKVRKARQADYIFWLQKDWWNPLEASMLLAGYEPEAFPEGDIDFSSLAGDSDGIHRLIIESINSKKLSVNNPPSHWIAWATQGRLTLPAELMAALPSQADPEATATPAPVVTAGASGGVEPAKAGPNWSLKTSIKRAPGYRWPLYQLLKVAHIAGQPCPKARDVLDAWTIKPPLDVQVMSDGVKYNDGLGNQKEANLKAIQQAIKGLLQQ